MFSTASGFTAQTSLVIRSNIHYITYLFSIFQESMASSLPCLIGMAMFHPPKAWLTSKEQNQQQIHLLQFLMIWCVHWRKMSFLRNSQQQQHSSTWSEKNSHRIPMMLHAAADVILAETAQTFWSYCEAVQQILHSTSSSIKNRGQIYSSQQNVRVSWASTLEKICANISTA